MENNDEYALYLQNLEKLKEHLKELTKEIDIIHEQSNAVGDDIKDLVGPLMFRYLHLEGKINHFIIALEYVKDEILRRQKEKA